MSGSRECDPVEEAEKMATSAFQISFLASRVISIVACKYSNRLSPLWLPLEHYRLRFGFSRMLFSKVDAIISMAMIIKVIKITLGRCVKYSDN